MPFTDPREKPALLQERMEIQNCQADWLGVIAATSAMAAVINPLLATLPPALASVFVISLKRQENGIARVLDDPPRQDYTTETRARSRRYLTGQFGDSDLAIATDAAVISTLRVTAYLEAAVRADERAQGAELAGDETSFRLRTEEALVFRERARAADADRVVWLDALSVTWADWASGVEAGEARDLEVEDQGHVAFQGILASGRMAGMVISDLYFANPEDQREAVPPRIVLQAVGSTRKLARSAEAFFADARTPLASRFATRQREPALPEGYQRGLMARERGELQAAEAWFREAASAGSGDAMFELGSLAIQMDKPLKAREWFGRAMQLTRAELRQPVHRVMKLKVEPSLEFEEREQVRGILPPKRERDQKE
jgi:hypothetical protein